MKVKTALILCAGLGKRLKPLTLEQPKPLLKLNNITLLENTINLIKELGVKKILLNTYHLKNKIKNYLNDNKFDVSIDIIDDGEKVLDTGGGIMNMINSTNEKNFLILNPDTFWDLNYLECIKQMDELFANSKIKNTLLVVNKKLSFDKDLKADFDLENYIILKNDKKNFIYIGCQILNKKLLANQKVENFSITAIWNNLIDKKKLFGFKSHNPFYHLTNLEIFKKLKDL